MKQKLFTSATICLLFLISLAGCGQQQNAAAPSSPDTQSPAQGTGAAPGAPQVAPSKSPIADPASPLYGWEKFSSANGKFSAIFPTRPKEDDETKQEPDGESQGHFFMAQTDTHNIYGAGYYDYPRTEDPKSALANIEETILKKGHGIIVSYKAMELDNHPATEFEFVIGDKPDYSSRAKLISFGKRVYVLLSVFLTAQPNPNECDAFFNSFSLQQN